MKIKILLICFLFSFCKRACEIDQKFKEFYYSNINILKVNSFGVDTERVFVIEASLILKKITGHGATLKTEFAPRYETEDFANDVKIWQEWYENNKCDYTMGKVDSIMKK